MSFPLYSTYKSNDVERLGELPAHWSLTRLGYASWVRARLGWKGLKAEEYVDDGYIFLATPNIKGREIDFEDVNFIDQVRYEESPEIALQEGDVLLAKDGSTLGTVNIVRRLPRPATVNSSIAVITSLPQLNGLYLYYLFQSEYLDATIQSIKGGMGVPHLFQRDLNKFAIPLPPLPEQTAIATFLDRETGKIDALVEEQRRLIDLLKEKRQAVISHAVTKGLNRRASMKDTGIEWLGEVPEHWGVKRLRFVADLNPSKSEAASLSRDLHVSFLPMENIGDEGSIRLDKTRAVAEVETGYTYFRDGDVTIAKITPCFENGKGAVMRELEGGCGFGTTELIVARPKPTQAASDFLYWVSFSTAFRKLGEGSMYGAGGQKRVPDEFVRNFECGWPPIGEQEAIAAFLKATTEQFRDLEEEAQSSIHLLQERRAALISAAVTGKIDVQGLVETREAAE